MTRNLIFAAAGLVLFAAAIILLSGSGRIGF